MIKVSDNLRSALDSNSRMNIKRVVEMSSILRNEDTTQVFQVNEFVNISSQFDDSSNGKALLNRSVGNEYEYNDFFSWDYFSYDTTNPKKLFAEREQGQTDDEYYAEYSTGISMVSNPTYNYVRYTDIPSIRFTYEHKTQNAEVEINGVTVEFGKDKNIYPKFINIMCADKNGNIVKDTGVIRNNSNLYSAIFDETVSVHYVYIDLVDWEYRGDGDSECVLNVPQTKIKISQISFGFAKIFSDEIMSLACICESAPLSDETPKIEASLVIWDNNRLFDENNPNGIYNLLSEKVIFKDYLVYGDEKVLIGTYVLKDKPKRQGSEATFTLTSFLLNELANNANQWNGTASTTTMGALVNYVVQQVTGIPNYFSNNEYPFSPMDTHTYSQLKTCSAIEVLQKASNNSGFTIAEKPNGKVIGFPIYAFVNEQPGMIPPYVTNMFAFNSDEAYKLNPNVICGEIEFNKDRVLPNECNVNFYDESGNILGYYDETKTYHSGGKGGETADYVVENDYVTDSLNVAVIVESYNKYKQGYNITIPYFSDPTLQVGDFVAFDDYFGTEHYAIVVGNNYSYPASSNDKLNVHLVDSITTIIGIYITWLEFLILRKKVLSSDCTDRNIPTAKAVYDMVGDVSSLI